MDGDGSLVGGAGKVVAILEAVNFQQVATRDVCGVGNGVGLFGDIDTMGAHIDLVANLIGAHITAVEHHIHELIGGVELQTRELAQS